MSIPIAQFALRTERDVVLARQRAREIAATLGLDNQEQIRIATATSEMARNAFRYARQGKVSFSVYLGVPQALEVMISDAGPGIKNLDEIFSGRYRSETGLGMGIIGTRRLMDEFDIQSGAEGTSVRMTKRLPRGETSCLSERAAQELQREIKDRLPDNPYEEIEQQNQELLKTLQELRSRQDELELLNRELEDTNRGVVALYAELDERADYLRRASELKTKFLSNVSHEFRTPLNSIISLARLLMERIDGDLTPEQMKQVRYIESSARDLQEMVNDLLDLAKVEAGKIKMRAKRFEVHELFSALKGMLKPLLADNTSVELVFEERNEIPSLYSDEGKISQILRNLISNALKFTPKGQVTISGQLQDGGQVLFSVADTGIGIPAEFHDSIFKEFSQVEHPLQDKHRGTGLGLPLCRNLAMLLGGKMWLESEPGVGSTFFVMLPAVYVGEAILGQDSTLLPAPEFHRSPILLVGDADCSSRFERALRETEFQPILASSISQAEVWMTRHTPAAVLADVSMQQEEMWRFVTRVHENSPELPILVASDSDSDKSMMPAGVSAVLAQPLDSITLLDQLRRFTMHDGIRRLLLVDDNEVSRYILRELLDQPWLQIQEAGNGTEALASLQKNRPDALILDLLMPDMSGFDVLRHLRAQPETEDLPVLIYTSKPLTEPEKLQLESWNARVIRKEEVSTRLSAQPFLDWVRASGLNPAVAVPEQNA